MKMKCEKEEYRKGCELLDSSLTIANIPDGLEFRVCCYQPKPYRYSGGNKHDIKSEWYKFQEYRTGLAEKLRNDMPNECDGCVLLKYGNWKIKPEISQLVMSGGYRCERCNVKCCYCNATKMRKASLLKNTFSYMDVLDEIVEFLPDGLRFNPIASEFTASPYKKELFDIMKTKNWFGIFLSNGFLFDRDIAEMMSNKKASINISVDAGTRQTFAKIKGVDYWDKLVDNLEMYAATSGDLYLKYVYVEGINDNYDDIDGFIHLATRVTKDVIISIDGSIDGYKAQANISQLDKCCMMLGYFVNNVKKHNLYCGASWEYFNENPVLVSLMNNLLENEGSLQ
jgi:pyruvate-formate lyase-activating enzyme